MREVYCWTSSTAQSPPHSSCWARCHRLHWSGGVLSNVERKYTWRDSTQRVESGARGSTIAPCIYGMCCVLQTRQALVQHHHMHFNCTLHCHWHTLRYDQQQASTRKIAFASCLNTRVTSRLYTQTHTHRDAQRTGIFRTGTKPMEPDCNFRASHGPLLVILETHARAIPSTSQSRARICQLK